MRSKTRALVPALAVFTCVVLCAVQSGLTSGVDTTPPAITCSVGRTVLWPATGGLLPIGLSLSVTDDCDPSPSVRVAVFSDEPEGVPPLAPDAVGTLTDLRLRAERQIPGAGRIYLLIVTALDNTGKLSVAAKSSIVPLSPVASQILALRAAAMRAEASALALGDGSAPAGFTNFIHATSAGWDQAQWDVSKWGP